MNERIKQLAEHAEIEFTYDPTETPMRAFVECWADDLEKFAELIVRQCARLVEDSKWNLPRGCTAADQAKYVKEHFGVKE